MNTKLNAKKSQSKYFFGRSIFTYSIALILMGGSPTVYAFQSEASSNLMRKCVNLIKQDLVPAQCPKSDDQGDRNVARQRGCVKYIGTYDQALSRYGYSENGAVLMLNNPRTGNGTGADPGFAYPRYDFAEDGNSTTPTEFLTWCDQAQWARAIVAVSEGRQPVRYKNEDDEAEGASAAALSNPSKTTQAPELQLLRRFGNDCVKLSVRENKNWNDAGTLTILKLENQCSVDQLVNVLIGTNSQPVSVTWQSGVSPSPQRYVWPEAMPDPYRFDFIPVAQVQSGFVLRSKGVITTEVLQLSTPGPIRYNIGACDWFKNGKMQASFHDSELAKGFVCAPIPFK